MSRPSSLASAPACVVALGMLAIALLLLGELQVQMAEVRGSTELGPDTSAGGGARLAARALGGLPSALPEMPQAATEGPYLLVFDALTAETAPAGPPLGITRPIETALRAVGAQLTVCVRERQPQAPRDPLPFELVLQRSTGRLHVLSLPPGIPASRGLEVSCLRQAIEKAESAELRELSAVVRDYLRLRVLVVNHVPGVTAE